MKTIYRYSIPITDRATLFMPAGAWILPAPPNPRNNFEIEIWAQVDTEAPKERREFRIIGTGNPMPGDCGPFIATVTTHDGQGVWHVYEVLGHGQQHLLSAVDGDTG